MINAILNTKKIVTLTLKAEKRKLKKLVKLEKIEFLGFEHGKIEEVLKVCLADWEHNKKENTISKQVTQENALLMHGNRIVFNLGDITYQDIGEFSKRLWERSIFWTRRDIEKRIKQLEELKTRIKTERQR